MSLALVARRERIWRAGSRRRRAWRSSVATARILVIDGVPLASRFDPPAEQGLPEVARRFARLVAESVAAQQRGG